MPSKVDMTAQGHLRATFHRSIERCIRMIAETTLRELRRPPFVELLELTALIAQNGRPTGDLDQHDPLHLAEMTIAERSVCSRGLLDDLRICAS